MRLSFAHNSPQRLEEGIRRIARVIHQFLGQAAYTS
jgi:DNA-binding transcriptional MocR family regulator